MINVRIGLDIQLLALLLLLVVLKYRFYLPNKSHSIQITRFIKITSRLELISEVGADSSRYKCMDANIVFKLFILIKH